MRDIATKITGLGSMGNALHGGTTRIIRVVGPPTLVLKGMRQRLGEITFHGAGSLHSLKQADLQ